MSKIKGLGRIFSLFMCAIFCIGTFPVDALALSINEDGNAVYEIGDTVWVRGEEGEPEQQCAEGSFWVPEYDENDRPVTKQGLCDKAEHSHVYACPEDCPLVHSHGEGCYELKYSRCAIHTHGDTCVTETIYACGMELHTHDESCGASLAYPDCTEHVAHDENCTGELQLVCGQDEHICITESCAADCAVEEHIHGDECDMDSTYYRWIVVEDDSVAFADEDNGKGLPIRFFIAAPGEQIDPEGTYASYRTDIWGKEDKSTGAYAIAGAEDNSQIHSVQGIRNANDESVIEQYVYTLGGTVANLQELKNFDTVTVGGKAYSSEEYEIKWVTICWRQNRGSNYGTWCNCGWSVTHEHIHIDGILSKKVTPAQMNLIKTIPSAEETQESFNFTLQRLLLDGNYKPINSIDTSFGNNGSIPLVATMRAGQTSADIVSPDGTEIGFGYYKLTENLNAKWYTKRIVVTTNSGREEIRNSGELYIQIATDGTFRFSTSYNGVYTEAKSISIENERVPLSVVYSWEGLPEGLAALPENATGITPGSNYTINTSYYPGIRVLGKAGVVDPTDNTDSAGYYYVFGGWQYYDEENEARKYISYDEAGNMTPKTIEVNGYVDIHGLWIREKLPQAEGYITINKSFVGRDDDPSLSSYYMTVRHGDVETDISAAYNGTWNADKTEWSYNFPIRESGEYIIAEGKYDVAGYDVVKQVSISPVPGLSEAGEPWESPLFETDGHSYTEYGQVINITLPYDTSAVSGVSAYADNAFYTGSVNFTNTYTKRSADDEHQLPDFIVRKVDGGFTRVLEGAEFVLTSTDPEATSPITVNPDELGYTIENLPAGSYTLVETRAPEGYVKDNTVYYVNVVEDGQPAEELRLACNNNHAEHVSACYVYVPVQKYKITVTDAAGLNVNDEASNAPAIFNETLFRLNIPNEQIKADLRIIKTFYDEDLQQNFVPTAGSIMVDIYGPVVYKDGKLFDHGPLVHNDLIIDSTGNWMLTIKDLPYGEYFVEETLVSLHGYTWTGTSFTVKSRYGWKTITALW